MKTENLSIIAGVVDVDFIVGLAVAPAMQVVPHVISITEPALVVIGLAALVAIVAMFKDWAIPLPVAVAFMLTAGAVQYLG